MSENENEFPEGEAGKPGQYVKLQMLKDGIWTWTVFATEGVTIQELRATKDVVAEVCRELEAEFEHGPIEYATPKRRY